VTDDGWLAAGVTPHSFIAAIVTLRKLNCEHKTFSVEITEQLRRAIIFSFKPVFTANNNASNVYNPQSALAFSQSQLSVHHLPTVFIYRLCICLLISPI